MAGNDRLQLQITGMHCASCVSVIESGLSKLDGVVEGRVNLALSSAEVIFDAAKTDSQSIIGRIKELGYDATIGQTDIMAANTAEIAQARSAFWLSAVLTIPLMVIAMWSMFWDGYLHSAVVDGIAQAVTAGTVLFYAGRGILRDAYVQASHFRANMNTLIAMGTLTAFGWSAFCLFVLISSGKTEPLYFESAGMIVMLILLGRFLEASSKGKAGEAIKALMNLRPSKATAIINRVEIEIEAGAIKPGMELLIKPGERIAADGEILEGEPVVDESMLTGESLPVEKKSGDNVYGGSLNGNVSFRIKVTAAGEQSVLASIVRLVSDAQSRKAPVQKLADRVAAVFVPIVIGIGALTFVLWYIFDPTNPMLIRSIISVFIIACPCALGLATPTAILAGTGRAAREGIIVRGGDILEKLNDVDTLIFDKTGTLTYGRLEVVDVKSFGQMSERNLVRIVGSAEGHSEHPMATAIVRHMKGMQIDPTVVKSVEALPGFGLRAEVDGRRLAIGNQALMEKEKVGFGPSLRQGQLQMEKGRTVVYVAMDGQVVGLLSMSDKLRSEAREVITALKERMSQVTMLSGDNHRTASGVAASAGLNSFEAEVKPDQKQIFVQSYQDAGYKVAMVGDGINDAPALATASVGIAIGSGTDVAMEAADAVLIRPELTSIIKLFEVAKATLRVIRQNLFWAFFYNVVAIPLAAGVFYPWFGWSLSPMIAAAAMAFSSLFVVSNSLRLNRLSL